MPAWALESGQDAGVWGGLSEDERRALKRRAARNRARLMEQSQSNFQSWFYKGKVTEASVPTLCESSTNSPRNSFSVRVLTICNPRFDKVVISKSVGSPIPLS